MILFEELIPDANALSRTDKMLIAGELAVDDVKFTIWSPESSFAAADIMLQALAADRGHS